MDGARASAQPASGSSFPEAPSGCFLQPDLPAALAAAACLAGLGRRGVCRPDGRGWRGRPHGSAVSRLKHILPARGLTVFVLWATTDFRVRRSTVRNEIAFVFHVFLQFNKVITSSIWDALQWGAKETENRAQPWKRPV